MTPTDQGPGTDRKMVLPKSALVNEAFAHVVAVLHPEILRHSVRTFLLGREAARHDGVADIDDESLCIAALFHDAGTADEYDGPARFEVEGATPRLPSCIATGGVPHRSTPSGRP